MNKKIPYGIAALILGTLACSALTGGHTIVVGSGHDRQEQYDAEPYLADKN